MPVTLRRLLLWTLVCVVSAAPSFALAYNQFDPRAMAVGVCVFICVYTAISSTETFERIYRRPFVRRTMYIGYCLRMALSIAIPIGIYADIFPGVVSLGFVENVLKLDPRSFLGTFVTTCVQGTILNAILIVFMAIVQAIQRAFCKPPLEQRGFAVIMPAAPAPVDQV